MGEIYPFWTSPTPAKYTSILSNLVVKPSVHTCYRYGSLHGKHNKVISPAKVLCPCSKFALTGAAACRSWGTSAKERNWDHGFSHNDGMRAIDRTSLGCYSRKYWHNRLRPTRTMHMFNEL